jgi:hypothetical protein
MTITEQLRKVIRDSGKTHYRIWQETGVNSRIVDRFMSGEHEGLNGRNINLLCEYFELDLAKKRKARKKK